MSQQSLREKTSIIIFGTHTRAGQLFDIALIYAILLSVAAIMLDSVAWIHDSYGTLLYALEWFFTVLFTLEYFTRIYCTNERRKYIFSFYGLVDLFSIVPTYLALVVTGANYLLMIRLLRVLRIFRVLKLARYSLEANLLLRSLYMSRRKILVFFCVVLVLSTIFGCLMFAVEGPEHGFDNIPLSIYWTIVTITTVGYGDIIPQTVMGQFIASAVMLTGYSIIAVPTGIITAEMASELQRKKATFTCNSCHHAGHDNDALHCKWCGAQLHSGA